MMASAPGQNYGGYESDFVEEAPEKFICSICTKVARDPHLTSCCGQHFCESCLENWFKRQGKKSCPHCREEKDFNHFLDKAVKREINELNIHCTHHEEGCQWIGELGSLQTHLNSESGCGYVKVACTNKFCSKDMKRKDLPEHLSRECPQRKYKCKHCGYEDTYQAITTGHYNKCHEYPLACPNKCGAEPIKRKAMFAHRDKCPEEPMVCPNKCIEKNSYSRKVRKLKRKDLPDHLSNQCYLRKYKCEHCGHEDTYEEITGIWGSGYVPRSGNHYEKCPKYPLECPNKCGAQPIKRKDMPTHRDECPLEPVECPFKEAGCETKLVRRNFDYHMTTQTQHHLLLTFQRMQALSTTCETLSKSNEELRKSNDELRNRCDELGKRRYVMRPYGF